MTARNPKAKARLTSAADLIWDDLNHWAGSRIVARGRNDQRQGRMEQLALIAQTKPNAYDEASRLLRCAGAGMSQQGKQQQWAHYLDQLRRTHARKRLFLQALYAAAGSPTIAGTR